MVDRLDATVTGTGARVLRGVSLEIERGEAHGLVGESGAGKSMIGKAVIGLLPHSVRVEGGAIRFDGLDLLSMRPRDRRRLTGERIAVVPQDPLTALNPSRRVAGQITDRLTGILGRPRAKAESRALELLEEVAIRDPDRVMRAYPHELSGGMRQRVLIAAAFAAEPDLVIADEPTTALDATAQRRILRLIADMRERHGTALLFVTHDMGVVAKLCQTVSVMYRGMIVCRGTAEELFGGSGGHPYAEALIAATPRHDRPDAAPRPVPVEVVEALEAEIAAADDARGAA